MYKQHHITAVIPVHNEEDFIGPVLEGLPEFVDRVLVVDDCSTDNTADVVQAHGDGTRVQLVRTPQNMGVGGAMITGFRQALQQPTDIVIKIDGDGQMPLEYLPQILDGIVERGADYSKGNRFLDEVALRNMPVLRLFGNFVLTFLNKLASGYWHVFDPQNGYIAIRAEALRTLDLNRINHGYFFENDMLVNLNIHNFVVCDVAHPSLYGDEESGINILQVGVRFPVLLVRRFVYRIYQKYMLRDFSPIVLFLLSGLLLTGAGAGFGLYTWIQSAVTEQPASTGTVMLSVLPLVVGFQLLLQAIVLDIQEARLLSLPARSLGAAPHDRRRPPATSEGTRDPQ